MSTRDTIISTIGDKILTVAEISERLPSIKHLGTVLYQLVGNGKLIKSGKGKTARYSVAAGTTPGASPKKKTPTSKPKKSRKPRAQTKSKPAPKPAAAAPRFITAMTADMRLALIADEETTVFSIEETEAIAQIVLPNFHIEA
jgi:hypothetical protein